MEKEQRTRLQKATQDARRLLEEEFRSQLLQTYDIDVDKVRWAEEPGAHLLAEQRLTREKLIAWIKHKEAQINDRKEALLLALREMAFTALNRFVALKLMEARELVRPCVTGGLESAGFQEFTAVAQGLLADQESSYRFYLETIFEDVSRELRALFNPRDPGSLLWPKRAALLELLEILNRLELAELWREDETLGWVYQYFNGNDVKEMREAVRSGAPRNSRELAVRNQFFTPRYVVEFLTDNTLCRIWYEMRQGNTSLKDRCRYLVRRTNEVWLQAGEMPLAQEETDEDINCQDLLSKPAQIQHRPLKDPREIRMLDPACGSMHFGLYAFDLYLEIYSEAWEIAHSSENEIINNSDFAPFARHASRYADKASFMREVPAMILEHNIHGIDIDYRATQIARLTLWLRAQAAWEEQQVEIGLRPQITRSNIVCAEPMPGERAQLAEFVDEQFNEEERGIVQQLLESIFDKMQLAGEAGYLLRIEEEIRNIISEGRKAWKQHAIHQKELFTPADIEGFGKTVASLFADIENLATDFWTDIERRVYVSLHRYAMQTEDIRGIQRRLFAQDMAAGFAFIDLCSKRYDVVLMNPPFGLSTAPAFQYSRENYPNSYTELLATFVERGNHLSSGYLGAITSRAFMVAARLSEWRKTIASPHAVLLADLGDSVMDGAFVEAAAYILDKSKSSHLLSYDLRQSRAPAAPLEACAKFKPGAKFYLVPTKAFGLFPKNRIIYSLSRKIISLLQSPIRFDPSCGTSRHGLMTWDDFRFVRTSWEAPPSLVGYGKTWEPLMKGGPFSRYRSNVHLLMRWSQDGKESRAINISKNGTDAQARQASEYWRQPGLCYSMRSQRGFSARILPKGCLFTGQGPIIASESETSHTFILGWINSDLIRSLLEIQANDGKFMSGLIKSLPWIHPEGDESAHIESQTNEFVRRVQETALFDETDHHFRHPPLAKSLALAARRGAEIIDDLKNQLARVDAMWNAYVNKLYGVSDELVTDLRKQVFLEDDEDSEEDPDTSEQDQSGPTLALVSSCWLSYSVGCAFGVWDLRCISDESSSNESFNPFDALPTCSPGRLLDDDHLPVSNELAMSLLSYPIEIPWEGILVDDPGHPFDIELRSLNAIKLIWARYGNTSGDAIAAEACKALGVETLREWFRRPNNFFSYHLKQYSKSRRQAPIYWQLSGGDGTYSIWLYYHRITSDTIYRVLRDLVEPRIQQAERELFELESQNILDSDTAYRRQGIESTLRDLRVLNSELTLLAPLWNPNLNDGVIINHAILWRITPYTPWQKKCKECWDKLVKGDYDWAHLAFHLWPERVIPNCTTDRSLAIAHGLEERLWQETNNGNWLPRQLSEADLQALIAEHTNPAVKSALERFLAAPPPVAPTRTRASRSTRSAGSSAPRRPRGTAAVVDAEATRQVLLALTAAPSDGLAKAAIADLIGVEANAITAVIKQLKESGQIDQLGERRGARYVLSEQGRAAVEQVEAG
jgi:hypothetical protein